MRSFSKLLKRLENAIRPLPGRIDVRTEFEGYPFVRIELGKDAPPHLLIDAGIHGEEPASVVGLLAWLEQDAKPWAEQLHFTILPCLNPRGFEHGTRRSRDAEDLNRHFDQPDAPLTRLVARALAGQRFALAMDLHEDFDFEGFYLYELKCTPPYLGERLLKAASTLGPLSHGEKVGAFRTHHGLLRPRRDRSFIRARHGWPIAFHHLEYASDHVVTVETPGRQPLKTRVAIQRACLNQACEFLVSSDFGGLH